MIIFLDRVGEYAEEGIKAINENKNGFNYSRENSTVTMNLGDNERKGSLMKNTGFDLILQQFYGLLMKKILYGLRNPFLTLSQLLLPLIFTISSILISRSNPKPSDSPALNLNLANFKGTHTSYFFRNETQDLAQNYGKLMDGHNIGEPIRTNWDNLTAEAVAYLDNISRSDLSEYSLHRPVGAIFDKNETTSSGRVTALFNNQAFHTPAISLAFADSAIIKTALNKSDFFLNVIKIFIDTSCKI